MICGGIKINLILLIGIMFPLVLLPGVFFAPPRWRRLLVLAFVGALLSLVLYNLSGVGLGATVVLERFILAPLAFQEHPYGRIMVFGFTLTGALALLYGVQLAKPGEQAAALIALASVIGVAFADNLITLFLFWEMLTFATAALILLKRTPEAIMSGSYFLFFHFAGGLLVLLGILQNYAVTGSFLLSEPQGGLYFFALGFGFKAAFLPLQFWVARGYPAASFTSSVILSGLTTKVGVYAIARILPPLEVIVLMGASMAVVGVICALLQNDMRRLLSYHIVSQVGYMVAGAGLATAYGVDGSLLHAVNHMLYKALLFMSVGAVIYAAQTEDLHELTHRGTKEEERHKQYIWKTLPIVTIGVIIGALSISGVPFFSGYVSKYILKHAMYDVGLAEVLLMLASIGTAASFCKLVYLGFFKARARIVNKIPVSVHLAIVGTAALCVILGVYPQLISGLLPYATSVSVYSLEGVWAALRLNIAGVLLFLNLAKLLQKGIYLPPWASIEYVIFAPLGKLILRLFCTYGVTIDSTVNTLYLKSGNGLYQFCQYVTSLDKGLDKVVDGGYVRIGDAARRITNLDSSLDQAFVSGYTHIGDAAQRLANLDSSLDQAFVKGYTHIGDAAQRFTDHSGHPPEISAESYHETDLAADRPVDKYDQRQSQFEGGRRSSPWTPAEWSTKNLNFDSLLLAMLLVVVLIVIFYFGR